MTTKRGQAEAKLQMVFAQFLRLVLPRDAMFFSIPNEGARGESATGKLVAMGLYPGAADLIVLYRGLAYLVEIKLETSKAYGTSRTYQSAEQKGFQAHAERAGVPYRVCRNTDELALFLGPDIPLRLTEWTKPRRVAPVASIG